MVDDEVLSNVVYVISSDYINAYGQQMKNLADPTDLSDAVTKGYVDSNFQPAGSYVLENQLRYALSVAVGVLSSGNYVYDVTDRTMTTIGID